MERPVGGRVFHTVTKLNCQVESYTFVCVHLRDLAKEDIFSVHTKDDIESCLEDLRPTPFL
jgi:hypothetical protein